MIPVTKPFLPPIDEYQKYVSEIWERNWLTNNGPLVKELEQKILDYLELEHLLYLGNGTIAIQLAIKALGLSGEVITTPFSYVATTSSIVWENCTPVFVDIDERSLNINPRLIEAAITDKTTAILATHCFGNPCDIDAIDVIAKKYNLKVIYDAAHCFGVNYKNKSVFYFGDVSTTSFHATKVFHTTEGGAVFTKDQTVLGKMAYMRNFGHKNAEEFYGLGINAKNSEFHAAMGLCNLNYIDAVLTLRKKQSDLYDVLLAGSGLVKQLIIKDTKYNYSYYPVIFKSEESLLNTMRALEEHNVYPRRYFYPTLNSLPYVIQSTCEISQTISPRILCLPLYHDLLKSEQELICHVINNTLISQDEFSQNP